jgi:tRNA-modifying protein YgfZ
MTPTTLAPDGAHRLTDLALIEAQGLDATSFVHNQLSNDFAQLPSTEARLAAYCSAKGRMLASLVGWRRGDGSVGLVCSQDIAQATLKRLKMFVMRADCTLRDASAEVQIWGLAGPSAMAWLGAHAPALVWGCAEHLGGALLRLHGAQGSARFWWIAPAEASAPPLPAMGEMAWRASEVYSGVAHITAPTVDQFVPQMLNYELVGGVNFKKGCYPGQEIVARSQYRGSIKRRCVILTAAAPAQVGQEIFHSAEPHQPAGMVVVSAQISSTESHVLAEIKVAALEAGTLHLASALGPVLTAQSMPYDIFQNVTD